MKPCVPGWKRQMDLEPIACGRRINQKVTISSVCSESSWGIPSYGRCSRSSESPSSARVGLVSLESLKASAPKEVT